MKTRDLRNDLRRLAALAGCALLAACTVGPDYVKPKVDTPETFKESSSAAGVWKIAAPADRQNRGKWWELFDDPVLNELEGRAALSNQNIVVAEAQFRQARAVAQLAHAGYMPTVTLGASASRFAMSKRAYNQTPANSGPANDFALPLEVSWEADIWGRVRRATESAQAEAQAAAAELENVRLSIQAELAIDYFLLRGIDAERDLLARTLVAYQKAYDLTVSRHEGGAASDADVAQSETQLRTAEAQAVDLRVQRVQLEHAIAILVGGVPSAFSLPMAESSLVPPVVPISVPSQLLERRADVASAERQVAAANARIGIAKAAYYPTLTLGGVAGLESQKASNWLALPSRFWALGADASLLLFDGGRRSAITDEAQAAYDATVASYRQTVLVAFQDVEDNLAALGILAEEAQVQEKAVLAARRSVRQATDRYAAGAASYLDVVIAQTFSLVNERAALDVARRRMAASVRLVKAMGGDWTVADLPTGDEVVAEKQGERGKVKGKK
ncbi:MAG TPA: efflux transporter outer membrane subunit [Burkholderiales bacterium]|nr:efflux transporter outer membrane subunit [Burkholderiales bacterium]